jgi:hypothetical protein
MLPAPGDFNSDDIEAVATVRVVIAEMRARRHQMDAVLDAEMSFESEFQVPTKDNFSRLVTIAFSAFDPSRAPREGSISEGDIHYS